MSEEVKGDAKEEVKEEVMAEGPVEAAAPEAAAATDVKTEDAGAAAEDAPVIEEAEEGEQEEGADEGEGEDEAGEDEEAEPGGDHVVAEAPAPADEANKKRKDCTGPLTLGYKKFQSSKACADYFKGLLSTSPMDTDMNEYEFRILLDLIQKGHPKAAEKIGGGLRAFQVRHFRADADARAFFAIRKDGSIEDFSYIKCLGQLYPEELSFYANKRLKDVKHRHSSDGGRGRGGRRSGRGGRGGRGGKSGRGDGGRGGGGGGRGRGGGGRS